MTIEQQADELAMRAASNLRDRDFDVADARDADLVKRTIPLAEMLACVEALRNVKRSDDTAVKQLQNIDPAFKPNRTIMNVTDAALAAFDAAMKKGQE